MKKSILIIDDEKEICDSLTMILEYEDYDVDFTVDVDQGLKKLEYNSYDALLLDIQMPKMTGFEVMNWIKENEINISTIIISAHGNLENAIKATKMGAFDFIEKPIDRDKLLISIRNAVDNLFQKRIPFSAHFFIGKGVCNTSNNKANIKFFNALPHSGRKHFLGSL